MGYSNLALPRARHSGCLSKNARLLPRGSPPPAAQIVPAARAYFSLVMYHHELSRHHDSQLQLIVFYSADKYFDVSLAEKPLAREVSLQIRFKFDFN